MQDDRMTERGGLKVKDEATIISKVWDFSIFTEHTAMTVGDFRRCTRINSSGSTSKTKICIYLPVWNPLNCSSLQCAQKVFITLHLFCILSCYSLISKWFKFIFCQNTPWWQCEIYLFKRKYIYNMYISIHSLCRDTQNWAQVYPAPTDHLSDVSTNSTSLKSTCEQTFTGQSERSRWSFWQSSSIALWREENLPEVRPFLHCSTPASLYGAVARRISLLSKRHLSLPKVSWRTFKTWETKIKLTGLNVQRKPSPTHDLANAIHTLGLSRNCKTSQGQGMVNAVMHREILHVDNTQ